MSIQLKCLVEGCDWKSQELPETLAEALSRQLAMHDKTAHSADTAPERARLQIDPPRFSCGANAEEWEAFNRQWVMYKKGTKITADQVPTALFYCCSEELRQDIMRDMQTDISAMSEDNLLREIRKLAVKEESTLVHRMNLCKMVQAPGMGVRTFAANLKGQAALCDFNIRCDREGCRSRVN